MKSIETTYQNAGVNRDAAEESLQSVKSLINSTKTPGVLGGIGHFGALFEIPVRDYSNPVLVSSMDGVGTKLKVAIKMDRYDSIGEDLVNHCVNDILTTGARPIFFLDYLSLGVLKKRIVNELISGMARGCQRSGCALIGGETAEMPDIYRKGEFDIAGTIIGLVEKTRIIDGARIRHGDVLLGLPSDGLHTNGYSLARKVFFENKGLTDSEALAGLELPLGEELLRIHRCYLSLIDMLPDDVSIHGMVHVTGGGIVGNLTRIIPEGLEANVEWQSWPRPQLFSILQDMGGIPEKDLRRIFNLGIGFIVIVPENQAVTVQRIWLEKGESSHQIGRIVGQS